jgi:hypothetical protein
MRPHQFEIQGLFGREKPVRLELDKKVVIIHGINGSGKTTILRLLEAVLTGRLFEIRNVNFKSLLLYLEDERAIRVTRSNQSRKKSAKQPMLASTLKLELVSESGKIEETSQMDDEVELTERVPLQVIEHEIPQLTRVGRREWVDDITGGLLSLGDVIAKYSDRLPWLQPSTEIGWYRKLVKGFSVKFIQTQRLMTMKADAESIHSRHPVRYQNTVIEYSEKLRELIKDKLSDSMRMAQSLDSSYPRRLLQESGSRLSDKKLKALLDKE